MLLWASCLDNAGSEANHFGGSRSGRVVHGLISNEVFGVRANYSRELGPFCGSVIPRQWD
jgi:hypothetical protein